MRNISVAITTDQIRNQTKTVTRRKGWDHVKVGDILQPVSKTMGLKKGEKPEPIGPPIKVIASERQPLTRMTDEVGWGDEEATKEGYPEMSGAEFVEHYLENTETAPDGTVRRIEFEYTENIREA